MSFVFARLSVVHVDSHFRESRARAHNRMMPYCENGVHEICNFLRSSAPPVVWRRDSAARIARPVKNLPGQSKSNFNPA